MILGSMIVPLLLSAQAMAGPERTQFSRCLRAFVDAQLTENTAPDAFDTAVAAACTQQETAYRTAYIAAATRAGDSRTVAQRDAETEVQDLRDNFKELYRSSRPE